MSVKVSIIVPVYKVEPYLCRCVDSILKQTLSDIELILVNDGSPDRCGEICDSYALKDSRVKVVHKENGGVSSARNVGLKLACGDFVGFVDSDDCVSPQMYQSLYDEAIKSDSSISMCNFVRNENFLDFERKKEVKFFSGIDCLYKLYDKNSLEFKVVWNKIYSKDIFFCILFPPMNSDEDQYVATRLYAKANKVCYVKGHYYFYFSNINSVSNKKFNMNNFNIFKVIEDRDVFFRENGYWDLYEINNLFFFKKIRRTYMQTSKFFPKNNELFDFLDQKFEKNKDKFYRCKYFTFRDFLLLKFFDINPVRRFFSL